MRAALLLAVLAVAPLQIRDQRAALELITRKAVARTAASLPPEVANDLAMLYGRSEGAPVWLDAAGRPRSAAADAVALLTRAAEEGLSPATYHAGSLAEALSAARGPAATPEVRVAFDVDLSARLLLYLRHLHFGRIDPRTLGWRLTIRVESHDLPEVLWRAIVAGKVDMAHAQLVPQFQQYARLRTALSAYRALAADADVRAPALPGTSVGPRAALPDVASLRRLLRATADLGDPGTSVPEPGVYDGATAEAVARFQARHGLAPDGVIGAATRTALTTPFSARVRQIEMALERLRWVSDLDDGRRLIAVNIPMFRLWAWDRVPSDEAPALDMAVVVGRALNHRTPVFVESLERVIVRPYWVVPHSIVVAEILPALARDPRYLDAHAFEIVERENGRPIISSPENLARLRAGQVILRQRPGPSNALGLIKFLFPNADNVYMHATPQPELFARSRRDFSHGCIRVENPVGLATWVLQSVNGWTREAIEQAMAGSSTRTIELDRPITVVLFYTTAAVVTDGNVHFADDVYGQDAALAAIW
jgi:murein L,D-transpeptidase YcbB/YkuD